MNNWTTVLFHQVLDQIAPFGVGSDLGLEIRQVVAQVSGATAAGEIARLEKNSCDALFVKVAISHEEEGFD